MLRKTFLRLGLGAGAACLANGCARRTWSERIVVSARPTLYMAPFYLAHESGYFREAGLDLELQSIEDGYQTVALLAGRKLDVAISSITSSLVSAIGNGADVRIVAGLRYLSRDCSDTGTLYASRAKFPRGLDSLATLKSDLRGKRVALNSRGNANEFYLDTLLDNAGLTEADVQIALVRFSEAVAAVRKGRIDVFMSPEQFSVQSIAGSPDLIRGLGMMQVLPGFQYSFLAFGSHLLNADPQIGARFLHAHLKGVADFRNGKTPRYLDDFARSNGLDVGRVRASCRDNCPPDGAIRRDSIQRMAQWFVKKGYCSREVSDKQIVDSRFLDGMRKEES